MESRGYYREGVQTVSGRRSGRPPEYPELARVVAEGWRSVEPGGNWRPVKAWFLQDRDRAAEWKRHVEIMGYAAVRQFVIDHRPNMDGYPYPIHPVEAIVLVARGATFVRPSEVAYRWPRGASDQSLAFGAIQAILRIDLTAGLNYRAGTIVCEVVNPEDCMRRLRSLPQLGNLTS